MPTYILAMPPSANHMFANVRGVGRVKTRAYKSWQNGELKALIAQRAKPVTGRATVSIKLPKIKRADCDNRIKPILDLLCRAGILIDDSSEHLASVSATWCDVEMCHVQIEGDAA